MKGRLILWARHSQRDGEDEFGSDREVGRRQADRFPFERLQWGLYDKCVHR